ncbi:hypothetical protein [Algisphaera agarilytica]|uniref:Uncharacterized protein n=1 Tax=Algisphaera agarilytica TaxID=1385975 RepID=A0A7X0H4D2_9BACT|nr:hypothetical protein [Algisphaera agarilytica]MBB6429035.1 hypothetical protein [Algisphaera agarilytica]
MHLRHPLALGLPTLLLITLLPGCGAGPPGLSELTDDQAQHLARRGYDQGYFDVQALQMGTRAGYGLGDVPGFEGDAWRLGRDDAIHSRPSRTDVQLAEWIQARRLDPNFNDNP